jgi:hypothetical protein
VNGHQLIAAELVERGDELGARRLDLERVVIVDRANLAVTVDEQR